MNKQKKFTNNGRKIMKNNGKKKKKLVIPLPTLKFSSSTTILVHTYTYIFSKLFRQRPRISPVWFFARDPWALSPQSLVPRDKNNRGQKKKKKKNWNKRK